jgi:integrase
VGPDESAVPKGRRDQQPPSEEQVWEIIAHAHRLASPSFAAWLQVAAFTGLRPGELDALRWTRIDFDRDRITVAEQFSAATRRFDTPKNHLRREAPLTAHARSALLSLPRESEFCFVSLRGEHWTPSSRAYHWKAVRAGGLGRQPLPRHAALRRLVHGQHPGDALRGRRNRPRTLRRREPRTPPLRPPRHAPRTRPHRRGLRHSGRREPSQAAGIIDVGIATSELVLMAYV